MKKKTSSPKTAESGKLKKALSCWQLYILLIPALIWLIVFAYYPMYGLIIAFKDFKGRMGIMGSPWADPIFKYFKMFFSTSIAMTANQEHDRHQSGEPDHRIPDSGYLRTLTEPGTEKRTETNHPDHLLRTVLYVKRSCSQPDFRTVFRKRSCKPRSYGSRRKSNHVHQPSGVLPQTLHRK